LARLQRLALSFIFHNCKRSSAMDWTNYIMTVVVGYPAAIVAAYWVARSLFTEEESSE
jgi:hypothetical protein